MNRHIPGLLLLVSLAGVTPAGASRSRTLEVTLRGRKQFLEMYEPSSAAPIKGTVIMGSGDVGWVGLAVTLAEYLSDRGFVVAGVNVRTYLASYSEGKSHVTVQEISDDYRDIATCLKDGGLLHAPLVLVRRFRGRGDCRRGGGVEESCLGGRCVDHGPAALGGTGLALERHVDVDHQARRQ